MSQTFEQLLGEHDSLEQTFCNKCHRTTCANCVVCERLDQIADALPNAKSEKVSE